MKTIRTIFMLSALTIFSAVYGQKFQSVKKYLTPQIDSCIAVIDQSKSQINILKDYLSTKPKHRSQVKYNISRLQDKMYDAQVTLKKLFEMLPCEQDISVFVTIPRDTIISPTALSVQEQLLRYANFTTILPLTSPIILSPQGTYYRIQLCTLSSPEYYHKNLFSQFPDHLVLETPPYTVIFSREYSTYEQAVKDLSYARQYYRKDAFITKWKYGSIVKRFYQ